MIKYSFIQHLLALVRTELDGGLFGCYVEGHDLQNLCFK